jgi:hypothetical protein
MLDDPAIPTSKGACQMTTTPQDTFKTNEHDVIRYEIGGVNVSKRAFEEWDGTQESEEKSIQFDPAVFPYNIFNFQPTY